MKQNNIKKTTNPKLPEMFRPLLWSYRFEDIDPDKHYHELVVNTVNYGTLEHWRWLADYYGKDRIRQILEESLETEFNPESGRLARILFNVNRFRHASRSSWSAAVSAVEPF